jgi:signal transduction histidine kinase/ActR/RegA family two-component response regulator
VDPRAVSRFSQQKAGSEADDGTTRVRAQRDGVALRLAVQQATARVLAAAEDLDDALERVLRELCRALGWPLGEVWVVDGSARALRLAALWHTAGLRAARSFAQTARATSFGRGIGLQGQVWVDGAPVWVPDVQNDRAFCRVRPAAAAALRGAIAFPIRAGGEVFGVFTFYSRRTEKPDDGLLATMAEIGAQLGQLIKRLEAQRLVVEERRISERLRRLAIVFATELDQGTLVERIADEGSTLVGADYGVFLFDLAGGREGSAGGAPGASLRGNRLVASSLRAPIRARSGEPLGELIFGHVGPERFAAQHDRLLAGLAAHAAVALENARLYRDLQGSERRARDACAVAAEASRRKDEFLAMLGHELRNPLAPIMTALELLKLKGDDPRTGRERQIIERQARHLQRLVDDLMDVSRITRGKIQLDQETVDVHAVVLEAIEMVSPLLEQRRHRLHLDVERELPVDGDRTRLAQVVANLLSNAASYTEPGGNVWVCARRDGAWIELTVRDDGAGIAPEALPEVFEMFAQGPRLPDRSPGGLGIGLTLVRSLVALHGGEVCAASDGAGRGSEFTVRLPLATEQAVEEALTARLPVQALTAARHRALRGEPLRVLVVDDNADALGLLADALTAHGYQVATAPDGPRALVVAAAVRPEVAILDIGLPVMDGYELAGRLRSLPGTPAPRLIAVTGYGQESDRERAAAAGFDAHLVKPVDIEHLLAVIAASRAATTG